MDFGGTPDAQGAKHKFKDGAKAPTPKLMDLKNFFKPQ